MGASKTSYFHICSAVNDQYNYQYNYDIVLDHQYHVIIKQTEDTYSINIDGEIVDSQASQPSITSKIGKTITASEVK